MKKSLLLVGLLALSSTMLFAHTTTNVAVSANLIRTVEITPQSSTTQVTVTNAKTGTYSFPDTTLEITGNPGSSVKLMAPQSLTLTKSTTAGAGGGVRTTTANVTFKDGSVTTDGTNAASVQILPASGNMHNALVIGGNLASALDSGTYSGTISIQANYN